MYDSKKAHKYYEENKEHIKIRCKEYRLNNLDKCAEITRRWQRNNPQRYKFLQKRSRRKHKKEIKIYNHDYFQDNKQKIYKRRYELKAERAIN